MKTKLILAAVLLSCSLLTQAQWSNPNVLKTANDNAGGIIAPVNVATDLAWDVSITSITSGYTDAVLVHEATWMATPYTDVDWISYPHGCNTSNQSESWCAIGNKPAGDDIDEYFKVSFEIGSCGMYCLNYTAWADNCIYAMYLNNTTTPFYTTSAPTPYTNYGFRAGDSINGVICEGFVPGINTLYVHVKSGNNPSSGNTGLLFRGIPRYSCPFLSYAPKDRLGKESQPEQQMQIENLKSMLGIVKGGEIKPTSSTQVALSDKNMIVLNQNIPNPFAESTMISYNIPREFSKAQMLFLTYEGKVIKTVDITEKGRHELNISANDLSRGMYSYKLIVDGEIIDSKKMIKE